MKSNPKPTPANIIESLKKLNINLSKKQNLEHFELVIKKNQRVYDVIYTRSDNIFLIIKGKFFFFFFFFFFNFYNF